MPAAGTVALPTDRDAENPANPLTETVYRRCLAAIAAYMLAAGLCFGGWGLPNGNQTWAADSVAPMTPLSVAYHVFAEDGPNSGYFYFKYPVGHQLALAAISAPIVATAWLTGDLAGIETDYPYGFSDPEKYLTILGRTMRTLSALFVTAVVLLVAGIARRLVDFETGVFAAAALAGSYPLMFYAHTSNVEAAFLFWAFLCLYAAIRGSDGDGAKWFWAVGISAAMAVSTKEQIAGFLVLLPAAILIAHGGAFWRYRTAPFGNEKFPGWLPEGIPTGVGLCAATMLLANAAFYNPSGFLNRYRFLTHTLPAEVREKYSAYEFPIDFSTHWGFVDELLHIGKAVSAVAASLGGPALAAALVGLVLISVRSPARAMWLWAPVIGYYAVSLRVLKQVEIRYTMPLSTVLAIPAGIFFAYLFRRGGAARAVALVAVFFGFVYSGEVLVMLAQDSRYAAERWMQPKLAAGDSVEVYQSWTYLPRWKRTDGVTKPSVDEMAVADVTARAPDWIVISSKAKEGITMYPNPDWRDGRGMMLERPDNVRMLAALEDGSLGYDVVAEFAAPGFIPRELITSLNPGITVYGKNPSKSPGSVADPG